MMDFDEHILSTDVSGMSYDEKVATFEKRRDEHNEMVFSLPVVATEAAVITGHRDNCIELEERLVGFISDLIEFSSKNIINHIPEAIRNNHHELKRGQDFIVFAGHPISRGEENYCRNIKKMKTHSGHVFDYPNEARGTYRVYAFFWPLINGDQIQFRAIKIGKVNPQNDDRFFKQHYKNNAHIKSSLLRTIQKTDKVAILREELDIQLEKLDKAWIKNNMIRINISLIGNDMFGDLINSYIESLLQFVYIPLFEGGVIHRINNN